nr:uncharacterized protein LOC131784584 isoform X1 [Pocillopora verrucosa]
MLHLSSLINLEQLSLLNNPCILTNGNWRLEVNYRPYLVYCCRNLRNLDGHLVNNDERILARLLDQAFSHIGHPSSGEHYELVSILHHICSESQEDTQTAGAHIGEDVDFILPDSNTLLESESFFIPVPISDEDQTESDDPIMTEEEALRLFSLAATIIQAHVRGYLVRKKFDFCQYRQRKYAAACIQAAWKGYHARTRDIKIVNIRNELRVRRLISLINHLYGALDREHEEAVKSREQFKRAIEYLWLQILEQSKLNEVQLRREQMKAAIKIQTWWRGCMARKLFPRKKMNQDQVAMLFAMCRQLQTQLNVVTSQINDLTKGKIQDNKSQHEAEKTDSEGSDQFYDTFDTSKETVETKFAEDPTLSPPVQHSDATSGPSPERSLVEERDEKGELKNCDENIPVSGELESGGKLLFTDDSVLLDLELNKEAPLAGRMDQDAFGLALTKCDQKDSGLNIANSSNSFEGETRLSSAAPGMEEKQLSLPETKRSENDTEEAPQGPLDLETERNNDVARDVGELFEDRRSPSSLDQNEPLSEKVTSKPNVETGQVMENTAPRVLCSLVDSQESDSTEKDLNWGASEGKSLQASIPEIIVSSPIPTDDEDSDEGDTSNVQKEVHRNQKERKGTAENYSYSNLAWKFSSSFHVKNLDQKLSGGDASSDKTRDPTSFKKERDMHEELHKNEVKSLRGAEGSLPLAKSNRGKPGDDEEDATITSSSVFHESVSSLGERATTLLSQLRSEIANMKTARLGGASSVITSGDDGATIVVESTVHANLDPENVNKSSGELATQESSTASEINDISKPEHAPAVTYRLPLFEDVDSTCTSLSLDDFLSDPVLENVAKDPVCDTGCEPKETDD